MRSRFIISNGTVTDRQTGLEWSRDAALSEFPLSWREAFEFLTHLNEDHFGGHDDWRLPDRRQLFSIVSHDRIDPALPRDHPFENVFPGYYWTATTSARLPDQAWYIHLGGAKIYRGMKYASYMVWPVRTADIGVKVSRTGQKTCYGEKAALVPCGNTCRESRFSAKDNVATDRLTGLMWSVDAIIGLKPVTWEAAARMVKKMNEDGAFGFSDWRIPHIRELDSLVDLGMHTPALPAGHPFRNIKDFYWSGTTSMYETRYAWTLYLRDGALGVGFKANPEFYLWPVRG